MKDMEALERLFRRRPDLLGSEFERRARSHLSLNAARQLLHAGAYLRSLKMLLRSLRLAPRYALPQALPFLVELVRLAARRALRR
jgi:hypothetical protein